MVVGQYLVLYPVFLHHSNVTGSVLENVLGSVETQTPPSLAHSGYTVSLPLKKNWVVNKIMTKSSHFSPFKLKLYQAGMLKVLSQIDRNCWSCHFTGHSPDLTEYRLQKYYSSRPWFNITNVTTVNHLTVCCAKVSQYIKWMNSFIYTLHLSPVTINLH